MRAFERKTAIVTGAGRGIGRVTARMFLDRGARVAYLSRTPHPDVLAEVAAAGDHATFAEADITDVDQVSAAFADVHERLGAIDILVNNAGVARGASIEATTVEAWDAVMAANVRGCFLCTRAAIPYMKARGGGRIVNVSSIAGRDKSVILGCSYTTSKAAIIGMTRHAAAELAPFGIAVNCVCPSQTRTPMLEDVLGSLGENPEQFAKRIRHPIGRVAEPREVAEVILFLASDAASYMNGAIVDVNGGLR